MKETFFKLDRKWNPWMVLVLIIGILIGIGIGIMIIDIPLTELCG